MALKFPTIETHGPAAVLDRDTEVDLAAARARVESAATGGAIDEELEALYEYAELLAAALQIEEA